jgi:formylglycine-generating enzyme required for sulfatase activity
LRPACRPAWQSFKVGNCRTPVDGSAYINPTHTDATSVVVRGGSYIQTVAHGTSVSVNLLTCYYRSWERGDYYSYILGFRCARDVAQ